MMRMLMAGGMEVIHSKRLNGPTGTDQFGTFELDSWNKELAKHPKTWTVGKALKVVSPYIQALPVNRLWKCVFMLRDFNKVISSLLAMQTVWEFEPRETTRLAHEYLVDHKIPYINVDLDELVKYPKTYSTQIAEFYGVDLDIDAMVETTKKKSRVKNSISDRPLLEFGGIATKVEYTNMTKEVHILGKN